MSEQIQREQLEISKEFLEYHHGAALVTNNHEKAEAYYDAIGLVDDALEEAWRTDEAREERWGDGMAGEFLKASWEAQNAGVKEATLHEQAMEDHRQKYGKPSLLDRLLGWWDAR